MKEEKIQFFSDKITIRGSLYYPDEFNRSKPCPGLIVCSGYTGLNAIYPRLFAESFTAKQFVILGFDYRGCGESEGERGKLLLEEQVKDIRNSITFIKYQEYFKLTGIGLLGWGMGAGLVISAAEKNPDIKAVAGINGFYNGKSFFKFSFSQAGYQNLLENIESDRRNRVFQGTDQFTDPFKAYPLDPDTKAVVDKQLRPVKNYEQQTSFELAESILLFDSIRAASRLTQPLLIAHGKQNNLHPIKFVEELQQAVPTAFYYFINGKHNDFMDLNNQEFAKLSNTVTEWFSKNM